MNKLTKSKFKKFLECPREFWLVHHHPEVFDRAFPPDIAFRIRQGYEVERVVKEYLIEHADLEYQFQKTVETERLIARFDVFAQNAEGGSYIYEIKSSKFIDPEEKKRKKARLTRLYDVGFQVFAAREAGLRISKAFLITLNGDYRLGEKVDAEEFLVFEDVTVEVELLQAQICELIEAAQELLASEPEKGFENLCSKKLQCEYFKFTMSDLPHPTIFNIPRLHKKKASQLLGVDILDIRGVPEDFPLTANQRDFVEFVKSNQKVIDKQAISDWISELVYPLYFLDYETVNPSIPQFKGMAPLQQITFQYSLHVKETPESDLVHYEFLSNGEGVPPHDVAENLSSKIGENGSILVWYKSFEMGRNKEMGELYPEYSDFFESVNERVVDLMEIFSKKLYRDPAIVGSSLKAVLPVLVPELSYDDMEVSNGAEALSRWYDEVYKGEDEGRISETMDSLREYCELDTLAMVEILNVLETL